MFFSLLYISTVWCFWLWNAEEQLLLCFNYSANYHDNLVTSSQFPKQKMPVFELHQCLVIYLLRLGVSEGSTKFFPVTLRLHSGYVFASKAAITFCLASSCSTTLWFQCGFLTSPSSFQKPSPEKYVILPWLWMVIGAVCLERGAQPGVRK